MKLSTIKYLGIALLLGASASTAWAADDAEPTVLSAGYCGQTATYTIYSDMSMVIAGTGSTYDYYVANNNLGMENGEGADPDSPSLAPRRAAATDDDDRDATNTRDELWTQVVKVEIGSGITRIGDYAFYGCDQLAKVHVGETPAEISAYTFAEVDLSASTLYVPIDCASTYASHPYWSQFGHIIEPTVLDDAVEVLPFAFGADTEVALTLSCPSALTCVAFDVVLPSTFVSSIVATLSQDEFATTSQANADGSTHVTIKGLDENTISNGDIAQLSLTYDAALGSQVYGITIQNIELTAADGTPIVASPYSTEIYAGTEPKMTLVDGVAAYHGNYGGAAEMALLKASLPTRATVDLTQVSALAEDLATTPLDNVIITTDQLAYGRTVANQWGTICLPFAIESDSDVQFYTMTGATEDCLIFEPVDVVAANTPSVFKATGDSFCLTADNDGKLAANFASAQPSIQKNQQAADWVMNGSYIDQEGLNVSALQAYAISADEVHRVTETLNVKAFRAWFQYNGAASQSAHLRIADGTNGIENIDHDAVMPATEQRYFDLNGRQLQARPEHHLFINNGKVTYNK